MALLLLAVVLLTGSFCASMLFLRLGARWARIPNITFLRVFVATLAIGLLSTVVSVMFRGDWAESLVPEFVLVVETGGILFLSWLVVKITFRTSWWLAIRAWLPTLIPGVAMVAFVFLVLRPYIAESYITPTHAMAPTLLGPHQQGRCPHCGQIATLHYNPNPSIDQLPNRQGICSSCQQAGDLIDIAPTAYQGDRFLVNKLLTPRRWDLITFRSVKEPSYRYAKRLVGFPGEEVVINTTARVS